VSSTLTEQLAAAQTQSVTGPYATHELTLAAVRYRAAGWPIVPVCHPTADRLVCGHTPPDPDTARAWWSDQPYGIACRTGVLFDALQVPPWLGKRLLPTVEHYATVLEVERSLGAAWLFLVTRGSPRIPDLPRAAAVELHGAGGWILLPPTPTLGGSARWINRPPELRLAHSLTLQWAVIRAVTSVRRERRR
jgi:hypothetical protein